jgi:hypothetical protein
MKEKFIAKVPESLIIQPQVSARTSWSGSYNAACWVRLQQRRPCKFALVLRYIDQEGTSKQVVVDQCSTELGATLLLSGLATIPAVGKIIDMGVYIETSENCPPYVIDELFVQSTDKSAGKASKLIAVA